MPACSPKFIVWRRWMLHAELCSCSSMILGKQRCADQGALHALLPPRGFLMQVLQSGTARLQPNLGTAISALLSAEFSFILVHPDVTNIAVSYRPCSLLNSPSYGLTDCLECSPAFQWNHLLWKCICFPIRDTTSYSFMVFFFHKYVYK